MKVSRTDVLELIEAERKNTFLHHLRIFFFGGYRPYGSIQSDDIKIWYPHIHNRGFHPIFHFKFNRENHLIHISAKLNPAGYFFAFLPFLGILLTGCYLIFTSDYTREYWLLLLLGIIVFSLLFLILRSSYKFETKKQLKQILKILDVETEKEAPEKEWTFSKILTRLFLYPFCVGLFLLGFFVAIPAKQYYLTFFCFTIPVFYFYIDLRILFTRKS